MNKALLVILRLFYLHDCIRMTVQQVINLRKICLTKTVDLALRHWGPKN